MRPDAVRAGILILAAVATGWIGWSGHVLLLPVALAFPMLWSAAPNRTTAVLVSLGYFLAASRGLPLGVATFYASDIWPGVALWFVAAAGFVVVHAALWSRSATWRPVRYVLAAILMAVPPFGITGWAHPITAAGVLFPGWGWLGLCAASAGLVGLVSRRGPAVAVVLSAFWLWSAVFWTDPKVPESWRGVDLAMGASLGRDTGLSRQRDLIATTRAAAETGARVIVLPESALGFWTPTVGRLWERAVRAGDATILAGAAVVDAGGYDNVIVAIDVDGSRALYRERMPVPGSMWQPWRSWFGMSGGARAHFFVNPVVEVGSTRVAPLICYEQLIVWPILQSMAHAPDVVVAVGNGWWTEGSSIVGIQRASATAWAALFAKPLVLSFNI
ncbi:MAG: conjugal transfer protein TraB [Sphingomonas hengshuiensis]|nr:MAG: conjugal transfer protein TraB [Sphingomonas hengshuiensis]